MAYVYVWEENEEVLFTWKLVVKKSVKEKACVYLLW